MFLELSDSELNEIQDLHELFDTGIFCLDDDSISFTMNLDDKNVKEDAEIFGTYGYILHMYHDEIDINSIDKTQSESIKNTLIATKELFQSININFNCDILDKLLMYFD